MYTRSYSLCSRLNSSRGLGCVGRVGMPCNTVQSGGWSRTNSMICNQHFRRDVAKSVLNAPFAIRYLWSCWLNFLVRKYTATRLQVRNDAIPIVSPDHNSTFSVRLSQSPKNRRPVPVSGQFPPQHGVPDCVVSNISSSTPWLSAILYFYRIPATTSVRKTWKDMF